MCVLEKLAYILTLYNSINVYMIYNKLVEMDGDFARIFKSACFFITILTYWTVNWNWGSKREELSSSWSNFWNIKLLITFTQSMGEMKDQN